MILFTTRQYERIQIYWDSRYAFNMDVNSMQVHILRQANKKKLGQYVTLTFDLSI